MAILVDASVFCAYSNSDDVHHEKAKKIIEETVSQKYGSGITTDCIFDETITVVLRKSNKMNAVEVGEYILNSELLVARIDAFIFQKSWLLFQENGGLSFTDCTSIAFMRMFGFNKIATFDKGFKGQIGFEVIDR